jgi:hypothetical protein
LSPKKMRQVIESNNAIGTNLNSVIDQAIYHSQSVSSHYETNTSTLETLHKEIGKMLNYDLKDTQGIHNLLYNQSSGLVTQFDMDVRTFERDGKVFLTATDKKYGSRLTNAVVDGMDIDEMRKFSIVQELPKINTDKASPYIRIGNMIKANTKNLRTYFYRNELHTQSNNLLGEAYSGVVISGKNIEKAIIAGDWEKANSTWRRGFNKPILNATGFTALQTVMKNGKLTKGELPNVADWAISKMENIESIINYIPTLYNNDAEFKAKFDAVYRLEHDTATNASKFIQQWTDDIASNKLYTMDNLLGTPAIGEYVVENMLRRDKILNRITALSKTNGIIFSEDARVALRMLNAKNERGELSQTMRLDKTANLWVSEIDRGALNPHMVISGLNRPLITQYQTFFSIDMDNISKNTLNQLKEKGISFGENVITHEARQYYDDVAKIGMSNYEGTFTGMLRQSFTDELQRGIDEIEANKKTIIKTFNLQPSEFEDLISQYRLKANTNQQHALMRPMLYKEMSLPELMTNKMLVGDNIKLADSISSGKVLNEGDLLGTRRINGEEQNIFYKGRAGTIETILDDGTMYLMPQDKRVSSIKVALNGAEKHIASSIITDNSRTFDAAEYMFDQIVGENVAMAAMPEIVGHGSGSIAMGSHFNYISKRMIEMGKEEELLGLINSNFGDLAPEIAANNRGGRSLYIKGNTSQTGELHESYKKFLTSFESLDADYAKTLVSELNAMNDNELWFVDGRRTKSNESYMREVRFDARSSQVLGAEVIDDSVSGYVKDKGQIRRAAQVIIDDKWDQIANTDEYKDALKTVKGIKAIIDRKQTGNVDDLFQMTMNFSDFEIFRSGMSAEQMQDTIAEAAKAHQIAKNISKNQLGIKLYMPEGIEIMDHITGKNANFVYMPFMKSTVIDDKVFMPSLLKEYASVANLINEFRNNTYKGDPTDFENVLQKRVDKIYGAMYHELNNKNGMVKQLLMAGRIPYSGMGLNEGIEDPLANFRGTGHQERLAYAKQMQDEIKQGKGKFYDTVWTSEAKLKTMGVDFAQIGEDVVKTRLEHDLEFAQMITDHKLGSNYDEIGKLYLQERGIMGQVGRYPVFKSTSLFTANIRLGKGMIGDTFQTTAAAAIKLNLDTDGDMLFAYLNLQRKKNAQGNYVSGLLDYNDEVESVSRELWEAQARGNGIHQIEAINVATGGVDKKGDYYTSKKFLLRDKGKYSQYYDDYIDSVAKKYGWEDMLNDNYLRNDDILDIVIKSRHNQIAGTGFVSNKNFILKDVVDSIYKNDENAKKYIDAVFKLTDQTEEKLISSKKIVSISDSIDDLTKVFLYAQGIGELAVQDGDKKAALNKVIYSLQGSFFDANAMPTAEDIINYKGNDDIYNGLRQIYHMFSDPATAEQSREIWKSKLHTYKFGLEGEAVYKALQGLSSEIDSGASSEYLDILTKHIKNEALGDVLKEDNLFYSLGGKYAMGNYSYKGMFFDEDLKTKFAQFVGSESGEEIKIYGKNMEDIKTAIYQDLSKTNNIMDEQALIKKASGNILDTAFSSVDEFEKFGIKVALSAQLLNNPVESDIINIVSNTLKGKDDKLIGGYTNWAKNATKADYLSTLTAMDSINNSYGSINNAEEFMRSVNYMKQKNMTDQAGVNDMINEMNEKLKERGKTPGRTYQAIRDEVIYGNIKSGKGDFRKSVDKIIQGGAGIKTQDSQAYKVQDVLDELDDIHFRDTDKIKLKLEENWRNQRADISKKNIAKYGTEDAARMAYEKMVIDNVNRLREENKAKVYNYSVNLDRAYSYDAETTSKYMNWYADDIVKDYINAGNIGELGKSKIGFGFYAGRSINDLSLEHINSALEQSRGVNSDIGRKTTAAIENYLNAMKNTDQITEVQMRESNLGSSMIDDMVNDINDSIKDRAKQELTDADTLVNERMNASRGGRFLVYGAVAVTAALGLASVMAGRTMSAPAETMYSSKRADGEGSPDVNGNYDESAPRSPMADTGAKSSYMNKGQEQQGQFRVRGKVSQGVDSKQLAGYSGGRETRVTTRDDTTSYSQHDINNAVANSI